MYFRSLSSAVFSAFIFSACGQVSDLESGESGELIESGDPALTRLDYLNYNVTVQDAVKTCRIESSGPCVAHPEYTFPLNDTYDNSQINTVRCLARASDYARWCNLATSKYVTAKSMGDRTITYTPKRAGVPPKATEVQRNIVFSKQEWALNGCMIRFTGGCPNHPTLNNSVLMDTYSTAVTTKSVCDARLSYWTTYCAPAEYGNTATANFFKTAVIATPQTYLRNLCVNRSCVGKVSTMSPYGGCFRNDWYSPPIKDAAGNWAMNIQWDSSPECNGVIAASAWNWGIGSSAQTMSVWLERSGVGVIPGSKRSMTTGGGFHLQLGSTIQALGGVTRACASITAGGGIGAASGCTVWH